MYTSLARFWLSCSGGFVDASEVQKTHQASRGPARPQIELPCPSTSKCITQHNLLPLAHHTTEKHHTARVQVWSRKPWGALWWASACCFAMFAWPNVWRSVANFFWARAGSHRWVGWREFKKYFFHNRSTSGKQDNDGSQGETSNSDRVLSSIGTFIRRAK